MNEKDRERKELMGRNIEKIDPSDGSHRVIQPPQENKLSHVKLKDDGGREQDAPSQYQKGMWKVKASDGGEESLELKDIREKIKGKEIGADTLVLGPNFKEWVPLKKVPQLSRFFEFHESIGPSGGKPPGGGGRTPAYGGGDGGSKGKKIIILGIILLIGLLLIFNPGGRIRFWQERGAKDILSEVEELLGEGEMPAEEVPLEEAALEEGEGEEIAVGISVPGKKLQKEAPDIFAEDIFALGLEKTEEEKKAEQISRLLLKGKEAIEAGNFADAGNIFTQVLKLDSENEEATNNMFLALSNLRESEAKANLSKRIAAHFEKAKLLYEEKAYEESLKEFEKVLELDPTHVIAEEYAQRITDKLSGEEARRLEEKRKREEAARRKAEEERQKKLEEMRKNIPNIEREIRKRFKAKEYDRVIRKAAEVLEIEPSNRTALGLLSRAKEEKKREDARITKALSKSEAQKRILEVEKTAVPTIDEQGITTEREGEERKLKKEEKKITPGSKKLSAMKERAQQLVSLDFKDADLRDVIRFLVEQTQVNIVIDESVLREIGEPAAPSQPLMVPVFQSPFQTQAGQPEQASQIPGPQMVPQPGMAVQPPAASGAYLLPPQAQLGFEPAGGGSGMISPRVTIYLVNVALERALEAVLRSKGLNYKIEEDIIWVSTKEKLEHEDMVVKVFTLKNALGRFTSFPSTGLSSGEVGGGKSKESSGLFGAGTGGGGASEEDLWLREIGLAEEEVKDEREEDIRDIIMQFVPQPEGSGIAYYGRLNKLIVRNTPTNVELVSRILESLDISAYQVAIEARIVEISSFKGVDVGISLEDILFEKGDRYSKRSIGGDITHGASSFGEFETVSGGLDLIYTTINNLQFRAVMKALEKNRNVNTLSAPKLTCMDNQTANIKVVKNYKYVSRWEYDTAGYDEYLREFWTPEIAELDEGILLEVNPHVNDENMTITLVVKPTVSELVKFELIGDEKYPNQLPITVQRSVETTVSMKNGHTLVMGGLMKNEDSVSVRKVPILGDIPIIGNLFRSKTQYVTKINLIIFIKATIIDSEGRVVTEKAETKELEL
jgi:type II secretory pathway component GspD/PulD (secretin)